jgi:hypothetical protein
MRSSRMIPRCCSTSRAESLLGQADDAVDHLGQSIAIDERFREFAQTDGDFDLIRDDPRFKELVG